MEKNKDIGLNKLLLNSGLTGKRIDIRVLIVDDNPINLKIIEGICKQLDWTNQSASDGQQAVDLLTSTEFDLIPMNCQMPVMDGYEATRIIRDTNSPVRQK